MMLKIAYQGEHFGYITWHGYSLRGRTNLATVIPYRTLTVDMGVIVNPARYKPGNFTLAS